MIHCKEFGNRLKTQITKMAIATFGKGVEIWIYTRHLLNAILLWPIKQKLAVIVTLKLAETVNPIGLKSKHVRDAIVITDLEDVHLRDSLPLFVFRPVNFHHFIDVFFFFLRFCHKDFPTFSQTECSQLVTTGLH